MSDDVPNHPALLPAGLRDLLPLRFGQIGPFGTDREAGHELNVEDAAHDRLDPGIATGCAERWSTPHICKQRVVKAAHSGLTARGARLRRYSDKPKTQRGADQRQSTISGYFAKFHSKPPFGSIDACRAIAVS